MFGANGSMRAYQHMAAANGVCAYAATASSDLRPLTIECATAAAPDSHFALLATASPSNGSPTQHCDWPEFHESYNSIMDNTNLLDSCAAALNDIDIASENGMFTEKLRHEFNRSLSSSTSTSTISGSDISKVTMKCIDHYVRWLCDMERRVAAQPKLSKIVAMRSRQKALQLDIHSKMFQEIVTRPCIVKSPNQNHDDDDDKSIEERYHVLYLKVYEVLLLLDGLPTKSFSPPKRSLSESQLNDSCGSSQNVHENQSSSALSSDADDDDGSGIIDNVVTTPAYNETNILSTSIGTYYFKHDDTIEQQHTDNKCNEKLSSTILGYNTDKEFSFEHDLQSLLNTSDSFGQGSHEHTFPMMSDEQPHSTAGERSEIF